jgi:hypothetical protein
MQLYAVDSVVTAGYAAESVDIAGRDDSAGHAKSRDQKAFYRKE